MNYQTWKTQNDAVERNKFTDRMKGTYGDPLPFTQEMFDEQYDIYLRDEFWEYSKNDFINKCNELKALHGVAINCPNCGKKFNCHDEQTVLKHYNTSYHRLHVTKMG
jgi:hypothetical protein